MLSAIFQFKKNLDFYACIFVNLCITVLRKIPRSSMSRLKIEHVLYFDAYLQTVLQRENTKLQTIAGQGMREMILENRIMDYNGS